MTTSAKQHVCISSETSIMMLESAIENQNLKREKNRSQKNLGGKIVRVPNCQRCTVQTTLGNDSSLLSDGLF